jgi:hypothetical protein
MRWQGRHQEHQVYLNVDIYIFYVVIGTGQDCTAYGKDPQDQLLKKDA